jgi:hypothetical protein
MYLLVETYLAFTIGALQALSFKTYVDHLGLKKMGYRILTFPLATVNPHISLY